jgi:hypothetical protein
MKSVCPKDSCTPTFIAASFIMANTWNQPKCPPMEKLIRKMLYKNIA